jgi:hypothetical protein
MKIMKNEFYSFFFIFFILISIGQINPKILRKKLSPYLYHPLRIKIDFSNITSTKKNHPLIPLLTKAKDIVSKLVLSPNIKKFNTNLKIKSRCKNYLDYKAMSIEDETDILIVPIFSKIPAYYKIYFCATQRNNMPSIISLHFNKKFNFDAENKNSEYYNLLNYIKIITDCLGLDVSYIRNRLFLRNNFFETPYYLLDNSKSFKSIKKLYGLSLKKMPNKNVNIYGSFYLGKWPKHYIVKDFKSQELDIKGDLSETSMNLFNDISFYKVAPCEFEFIQIKDKKKCFNFNQKCMEESKLNSYYLTYGINSIANNEIICYLSNTDNIIKDQCGIKYGKLLSEENYNFCPFITKEKIKEGNINNNQLPDLVYHNQQTLNLLKPSPKCKNPSPRTIYFKSFEREENTKINLKIQQVTLKRHQKEYFVTYLTQNEIYFKIFVDILNKNGIIRSFYHNNNHNLYIKGFQPHFFEKENKQGDYFNEYQNLYHFMGVEVFFYKNLLYQDYSYMRSYFRKSYNYMPLTYEYPKDKEKIEKRFSNYTLNLKDLWIVKPINLCSGLGIHIFKSLEEENEKGRSHYLLSKYFSNPHLINGKKYDMRLYVLISGFEPLRIYLYNEGLIRIAADKYKLNKNTIENKFAHLTNTAINVHNKKYINPKSNIDEKANKWNLLTYRQYLKKKNINVDEIFAKIEDIIIKTIIAGQRHIIDTSKSLNLNDRNMFNIFGFDIILDNKFIPHLLEVNTRPFMKEYNKYDKIIKSNLFVDTLNIVGITPFSHFKNHKSFDDDLYYKNEYEKKVDKAYCELTRPRGDFKLIFPLKSNIETYRKFFFKSVCKENKLFWNEILKDRN